MRKNTIILCLSFLAFLFHFSAHAASLSKVLRLAEQNDQQWQAAKLGIDSQREIISKTAAAIKPQLSVSAFTQKEDTDLDGGFSTGGNTNGYSADLTQALFQADAWFALKAAKTVGEQLDAQLQGEEEAFLLRVAEAYLNAIKAVASKESSDAELSAIARQLEQTQQRFDVGLIAITDVHEAQAAYDLSQVNHLQASNELTTALNNLGTITNQPIDSINKLKNSFPAKPLPKPDRSWQELAQQQNAALKIALTSYDAANYQRKSVKSEYAPVIQAFARYNHSSGQGRLYGLEGDTETKTVGVQLSMPIYQGGGMRAKNREAAYSLQQSKAELEYQTRSTIQNVQNQEQTLNTFYQRVIAHRQAIRSAESALEATTAGYEVGTRNVVDVLAAQQRLFATKRDFAHAQSDYLLAHLTMLQLAGELDRGDILAIETYSE